MRIKYRPFFTAVFLFLFVVLPLGLFEGWYGRVDYSGDAIPYLDMARALEHPALAERWRLALNPLWGLGYALLVALCKLLFAATPSGEWNAIHLLNILVYSCCYAAFLFLLDAIQRVLAARTESQLSPESQWRVLLAGTALFLSAELCLDTVSRVGPDTLVTTLVLLALGLVLRLREKPGPATAALLGAVLGIGYVVKTIFLPLSLVIVVVAGYALYRRRARIPFRPALLVWTVALAAVFALPYAAGLSWAFGRLTFGESGSLNYAWHVNRLQLMHWQGGPAQFGRPLHSTTMLLDNPPIYAFSRPFNVSYPPFFNPPYYYEGYRHFFSAKLQAHAIAANFFHLYQSLHSFPMTWCVVICVAFIFLTGGRGDFQSGRNEWLRNLLHLWPILLPALAGIALYIQVHLEGRYLPAFLLVLAATPIALFLLRAEAWPGFVTPLVMGLLTAGCLGTLVSIGRPTIEAARHHVHYWETSQWNLARYLEQHGLAPGDAVAVVPGPANHCTWAHVDRLHIVAELEPDIYAPLDTGPHMFWDATPSAQAHMLDLFRQAGAKAVIAQVVAPEERATPGWDPVPGTDDMVRDLTQR